MIYTTPSTQITSTMAVLEGVPGIKVTVKIEDATCIEYDDPQHNDLEPDDTYYPCPTVSKYIESIDNAEFGILCEIGPEYAWGFRNHVLDIVVRIDGNHFESMLVKKPTADRDCVKYCMRYQIIRTETGSWVTRTPKFSTVTTGDVYVESFGCLLS